VYRHATISLAGLGIDPASLLSWLQGSPAGAGGLPVTSQCVPTQSNNSNRRQRTSQGGTKSSLCAGDLK
jgi:hypothetical protein